MGKSKSTLRPEDILADHNPEVQLLAERLREIIRASAPEAEEVAYPVWHGIGYRHPASGYFCAIFPQQDSVNLGFEFGVLLPDPYGILEGDGKQLRYVRIKAETDVQEAALRDLIMAAINLPGSRAVKLELIKAAARPVVRDGGSSTSSVANLNKTD